LNGAHGGVTSTAARPADATEASRMNTTVTTHYAPHDQPHDFAYCGVYLSDATYHSPQPTCPTCAAQLAAAEAIDAAIEETPWPLDADEAAIELDPLLNAGLPASVAPAASTCADEVFAFAVSLNRAYAETVRGGHR
jgi:hypothetical protein